MSRDPRHPADSGPTSSSLLLLRVFAIGAAIVAGLVVIWYRSR